MLEGQVKGMRRWAGPVVTALALWVMIPVSIPLLWMGWSTWNEPKKLAAMRFCESFIPLLDAAYAKDGHYPEKLDPAWLAGKRIPDLIRPQDFYLRSFPDQYLLRFRNPGDFWDDIWGYHGRPSGGVWANYDGY